MTESKPSPTHSHSRVVFAGKTDHAAGFFLLLQQGVMILRRVGCSVESFLRHEIGARQETIELIQSVMLDGRPVDDILEAQVSHGSTLALSAAMPGLVGATLRRGGTYASLRSGITHREAEKTHAPGKGWVTVKLFNLVLAELGPGLLREGVLVKAPDLLHLVAGMPQEVWLRGGGITLDGKAVAEFLLRDGGWLAEADQVLLSVVSGSTRR